MPVSKPASRTARNTSACRRPMCGAGSSVPLSSVRTPYMLTTDVRLTFLKNPGRNTRRTALPVLSGPSENKKHAGIPYSRSSATSAGTPTRVPRSVSMSIFRAILIGLVKYPDYRAIAETRKAKTRIFEPRTDQ